jgi:hypothetical protein
MASIADEASQQKRRRDDTAGFSLVDEWVAGLVVTAPIAPAIAMAATLVLYVVRTMRHAAAVPPTADAAARAALEAPVAGIGHQALLQGILLGLGIWIVIGLLARPFVGIAGANRSVYRDLRGRVHALDLELKAVASQARSVEQDRSAGGTGLDVAELMRQRDDLARELGLATQPGTTDDADTRPAPSASSTLPGTER